MARKWHILTTVMDGIKLKQIRPNFAKVSIGRLDLYFSYATVVAIDHDTFGLKISENQWSVTTGKHLTQEFGTAKERARVPAEEFNRIAGEVQRVIAEGLTLDLDHLKG